MTTNWLANAASFVSSKLSRRRRRRRPGSKTNLKIITLTELSEAGIRAGPVGVNLNQLTYEIIVPPAR